MGDFLELPNYAGFEILDEDHRTGIIMHRAHVANQPHKRVIIKSLQFHSDEENQNLKHEYDLLKQINKYMEESYVKEPPKTARRRSSIKLASLPMMIQEKNEGFSSNPALPLKQQPLIPQVVALEKVYEEGYNAIVCEEFDGIPLRKYFPSLVADTSLENLMERSINSLASIDRSKDSILTPQMDPELKKLDFEEILQTMILIAEALDVCHRAKIAHMDMNPNNILIQKSRGRIQIHLVNFYNALRFDEMSVAIGRQLRSYTYASPEQTGRTDRIVDYRSDMYSLGITFWEMLVEDVPFKYSDASEMIYAHLAKNVPSPTSKVDYIPQQLSEIILKLVRKDPSERYQLASAVRHDLQKCLDRWNDARVRKGWKSVKPDHIKEAFADWNFVIGEKDYSQVISFPSRPIGRKAQMDRLNSIFNEWTGTPSERRGLFVCLSGSRGCGKYTFWEEICRLALANNCFTLEADSHVDDIDVPYFAYRSILDQLVKILLAESTISLKNWEEKLVSQIGIPLLTLLSFLVPSITHIVTNLPKVEENSFLAYSKQLELYQAVQYFLDLFATEEHPVLINLNYLNSGPGTVEMTSYLMNTPLSKTCLFFGYLNTAEDKVKPNQLSASEVLTMLSYPRLEHVEFSPLNALEIEEFLNDILRPCYQSTEPLASIMLRRTGGNYSFLKEYIKFCEKKELIKFDPTFLSWTWEIKRIESELEITNNAAELMMMQLNELDPKAQYLLRCGSCIGNSFDVRLVSQISNIPITQVQALLNVASMTGYIIPFQSMQRSGSDADSARSASAGALSNGSHLNSTTSLSQEITHCYKFCHPILSRRLFETIENSEKEKLSLSIARYYKSTMEDKFQEKATDMLRHYQIAINLLNTESELYYVAEMNYKASFRATSLAAAEAYLNNAAVFLSKLQSQTKESLDLEFQVQYSLANISIQLDKNEHAESIITELAAKSNSQTKTCKVVALRVIALAANKQTKGAIQMAMTSNSDMAKYMHPFEFYSGNDQQMIETLNGLFGSRTVEEILGQKRESDEAITVLENMLNCCIQVCQKKGEAYGATYFNILTCALSLNHGVSKSSSENFAFVLPYFLGRFFNYFDFKRAKFIGELVLASSHTLNSEGKLNTLQGLLKGYSYFWSYYEANERMTQAVKSAIEEKMVANAFDVMLTFNSSFLLPYGKPLVNIREYDRKFKTYHEFTDQHHRQWDLFINAVDSVAGGFDLQIETQNDFSPTLGPFLHYANALTGILYSKEDRYLRYQNLAKIEDQIHGSWIYVDYLLFGIVLEAERVQKGTVTWAEAKLEIDHKIQLIQTHVSAQFSNEQKLKFCFAKAIQGKMEGSISNSITDFEEAIDAAQVVGNTLYLAWINEMYGSFWLSISSKKVAKTFLTTAMNTWEQWGSEQKAFEIASKFPEVVRPLHSSTSSRRNSVRKSKMFSSLRESQSSESDIYETVKSNSSKKMVDIDINTVLKVTNSITNETDLDVLVNKILGHLMSNTGASRAVFFLNEHGTLKLQKILNTENVENFDPKDADMLAPTSLINYIFRTQESKVYSDCPSDSFVVNDPYIEMYKPKSILCCPIKHQNVVTGAFYLENRLQNGTFTTNRVNLVKSLMASASISIANAQLLVKNKELAQQLQHSLPSPKYTVETPIQKVFEAINSVKSRFDPDDPIVQTLDVVLSTLMSDGLFNANLGEVNDKDGKGIDQDTKNWIESSLLMTNHTVKQELSFRAPLPAIGVISEKETMPGVSMQLSFAKMDKINALLSSSANPSFDCFELNSVSDGQPLYFLTTHLLTKYRIMEAFDLKPTTVQAYLQKVESGYNKLPYHNNIHATDVLQSVELLLLSTDYATHFTPLEIFSLIIASAVHDLDHPGINNNFLVQVQHPMAIMYNDIAVLESHHAARAFEISKQPGYNLFETMTGDQFKQARKMIISIVLATDLAQHFQFISKFKGKTTSGSLKLEDDPDRHLVMEMAVKCGDLGNPVKSFNQAKKWTNLVMEEFFRQGDREKSLGLPVSKFMDRNDTNISKCQIGFIDFLVTPLYDAWATFSKTEYTTVCLQNIANNRSQWQLNADNPNILDGVPPTEFEKLETMLDWQLPPISFGSRPMDRKSSVSRRYMYGSVTPIEIPDLKRFNEPVSARPDLPGTTSFKT